MTHYKVTVGVGDNEQVNHFDVDRIEVSSGPEHITIEAYVDGEAHADAELVGEVMAGTCQPVTWTEVDRV